MQLEAGKKYTDRRGRVYGPLSKDSQFYAEQFGCQLWYDDGRITPGKQFDMDLVAEYVEPVKAAEPEYRMLQPGEPFQDGDEYRDINGKWCKAPESANRTFDPQIYFPHRRLVQPAPVESPDDLVIQDRVPAREEIDFGWNVSLKEWDRYKPCEAWKWIIRDDYVGRTHGSVGNIGRLAVFCRRKDLPPVPPQKPVEPEFPQYYVSGESPWAFTAYVVRRVKDVYHCIDERGEISSTQDWRSFHDQAVAEGRWKRVTQDEAASRVKKTRTVVLKEWLCWDDSHPDFVAVEWSSLDPSSDDHQFEAYDHAHATGNTRTVEIPVT